MRSGNVTGSVAATSNMNDTGVLISPGLSSELSVSAGGVLTVKTSVCVSEPPPFTADMSMLYTPLVVGVPYSTPVFGSKSRPGGSVEIPKITGLFVAVIAYEKSCPTTPSAVSGLSITGGRGDAKNSMTEMLSSVPEPNARISKMYKSGTSGVNCTTSPVLLDNSAVDPAGRRTMRQR